VLELPPAERRRLNPLTSFALAAGERLVGGRPHDLLKTTPLVFGSSDGDGTVLLRLLSALRGHQPVSPTQFHNSVHNAPAGYWSIGPGSQAHDGHWPPATTRWKLPWWRLDFSRMRQAGDHAGDQSRFPPEINARPDLQTSPCCVVRARGSGVGWRCVVCSDTQQAKQTGSLAAAVRARRVWPVAVALSAIWRRC
jgi:hypothetical protein